MAFNDIQAWRDMMDAQDAERDAYEKACEDAERRAAELDQREYDEIDQEPVGDECACACGPSGCRCLDDLEDDEIDFSAYGIDEADLGVGPADGRYATPRDIAREPLVRLPAAIGRPVSDADLVAQDVVQVVAEAVKKIVEGRKNADDDVEFEESEDEFDAEQPEEQPKEQPEEQPGELGPVDEADEAPKAGEKIEQMADCEDYPLTDADWKEVFDEPDYGKKLQIIQAKVADRWDGLSAQAKSMIKDDIMELRKDLLKSRWSEAQFKKALRYQEISSKRDLTDKEFQDFKDILQFALTPEQISKLYRNVVANGYRVPQTGRTTVVPRSDAQSGNVKDAFAGVTADEKRNETGVDTEFDPEKFQYVPEPMEPGTVIPADFNPHYLGSHKAAEQRDVDQLAKALLPWWRQELRNRYGSAHDGKPEDYSIVLAGKTDLWKDIVKHLDPDELEEIEGELAQELPFRKEETDTLLNCMFHTFKITRQDQQKFWGVGGD